MPVCLPGSSVRFPQKPQAPQDGPVEPGWWHPAHEDLHQEEGAGITGTCSVLSPAYVELTLRCAGG